MNMRYLSQVISHMLSFEQRQQMKHSNIITDVFISVWNERATSITIII